jgi:1,4-alpha-glucan branching enzyme
MDVVLNHTYGPSPLRNLYYDAATSRPAANNPWYNPIAPHAFGFGDDFNHESADTKYFFGRVLRHWLSEYKIDGYRLDFTKGLTQKPSTSDAAFSAYDASRIALLKGYADTVRNVNTNGYVILEHFCDNTEEKELSDYGLLLWANVWTQYQEASMGYLNNSNFEGGIHSARGWTNPHLVAFMESHDEERITYKNIKYGNSSGSYNVKDTATALKRMELNAAFLLTIPGPKMIWQFGELGYDYSRCYLSTNGEGGDCDKKLDPKPIRWDYQADLRRKSVFNVYSGLNRLRFHQWYTGAFQSGTIDRSLNGAFKWIKVTTANDTSDLVVIGNFDVIAQTGTVTFPTTGTWYDYFGNFIHTSTGAAQSFTLQPGEYHVYVNRNVNNLTATPVPNVPWSGTTLEAKVYPNPLVTNYTIELKLPQSGSAKIDLYNSVGQHMKTVYSGFLTGGTRTIPLPKMNVPAGSYYLKVEAKGAIKTVPLTLQ